MIKIKKLKLLEELTIELIKKINEKHTIDGVISDNSITIKIFRENIKEIYKKILVEEEDNKLKILILPDKISRLVEMSELEEIITIIEKQSQLIKHTQDEIKEIKAKYKAGTRIKLIKMYDLYAPPSGTIGVVENVDDIGQIHIKWQNKSGLALIVGLDEFEILDNRGNK